MPSVTRSQIKLGNYPRVALEAVKGVLIRYGEYFTFPELSPVENGQIISSLKAAILGEVNSAPSVNRFGAMTYPFDPPRLQTIYTIQFATMNLPSLELVIKQEGVEREVNMEVGWLVALNIAGSYSYAEPVTAFSGLTFNLPQVPPVTKQFEFTASLGVQPGVTLEVIAVPFIRVISLEGAVVNFLTLRTPIRGPLPLPPSTCILNYQQERI